MKITMTNKPIISADLKASEKEMKDYERFLEDFMGMILSACESICVKRGINDLENRKTFTKDILKLASIMADNVYNAMIKDQTESQGKVVDGSELIDFMDDIYNEYIEICADKLGRTKEEILGQFDKEENYSLEVKNDACDYGFYLTDSKGNMIPLGQVTKESSEEEKRIASGKAFIFAGRLLYYALGKECSDALLKKYENLEYMYDLIKVMERDNM